MRVGVRWYLVGSLVLVSLVGCGRAWFGAREPWRREAEVACLKSGVVKEGPAVALLRPIDGPGMCGAAFPLKVAALGEQGTALGFANDLRPPAPIPQTTSSVPPQLTSPYPPRAYPSPPPYGAQTYPARDPYGATIGANPNYAPPPNVRPNYPQGGYQSNVPMQLHAPGTDPDDLDESEAENLDEPDVANGRLPNGGPSRGGYLTAPPRGGVSRQALPPVPGDAQRRDNYPYPSESQRGAPRYSMPPQGSPAQPLPRLGPSRGPAMTSIATTASIEPPATLACPIVSALDRWVTESVQPAAQRWFGQPITEIKQISAYSCRGMNGNSHARISEHAFGNALDIAGFTLADGRKVTVKEGWRGAPEEQGFLRDVHAAACEQFSTVLAPGSNAFHYDHIHVDLMRRSSGRAICNPGAIPGDVVAARAVRKNPLAQRFSPGNAAIGPGRMTPSGAMSFAPEPQIPDEVDDPSLPKAVPGED
jgi:hypothetical protein